jgi:STE24 endopeptidase
MTDQRWGGVRPPLWRRTPFDVREWFDAEQIERSRRYSGPRRLARRATAAANTVAMVLVIGLHVVPSTTSHLHLHNWFVRLLVANVVVTLLGTVMSIPESAWSELAYDKKWDLSNQTTGRWVGDLGKGLVLGIVLNTVLLTPVYAIIRATQWWWLWATVALMALNLVLLFVYPVLIMPIFNKFTPLEKGDLRERIDHIAALAAVKIRGSFTMDGSRRSRRDQAFVAGYGSTKRVVVYDTMLEHPPHVIEQVVAHEIGHYRLHHIFGTMAAACLSVAITFGVLELVVTAKPALDFAGVKRIGDPESLPLFLFAFGAINTLTSLIGAVLSRHNERQADLEALELLGDAGAMVDVWRRMAPKNLADLEPTLWQRWAGSHPEVAERMAFARDWARLNSLDLREPPPDAPDATQAPVLEEQPAASG